MSQLDIIPNRYTLSSMQSAPRYDCAHQALAAHGMDWSVDLEDVYTSTGRKAPAQAVVRSDTGDAIGVVGARYAPMSNRAACEWLDLYKPHGVTITGATSFKGGQRCVMFADIGAAVAVKPGDLVKLQLVASWSHDGSSGTSGMLRVIRLVCTNGLCLASDAGSMFTIRHTGTKTPSADVIQADVRRALSQYSASIDAFRTLASRPAKRDEVREYVRTVFALESDETISKRGASTLADILGRYDAQRDVVSGLLSANHDHDEATARRETSILDGILHNWEAGRGQQVGGAGTWWNAYNAVTEYLTHERGRTDASRAESGLFGEAARINERALSAALAA